MDAQPTTQQTADDTQVVLSYNLTCDAFGRVVLNDKLIGGVEDEGDYGWTAATFFEDELCWDSAVEHDHPYSSRGEAVRAIVTHRWELLEKLERLDLA